MKTYREITEAFGKKSESLWKYNKTTGYWVHQRNVTAETRDGWLKQFQHDEPEEHFEVGYNQPKHKPK